MKNYTSEQIRNVALLGHGGSGKTSLAEAMLYRCKHIDRIGKVTDGNTASDFDPEEIKRKFSISSSLLACEWKNTKINFLDTPGFFDYEGEVTAALRVAGSAVICVPAKNGVEVGTEKAVKRCRDLGLSVIFVVTKMDEENADYAKVIDELREKFGKNVQPAQLPIMDGKKLKAYADLIENKAYTYTDAAPIAMDIPENIKGEVATIWEHLKEYIAETDEELMMKFFAGEEFTHEELVTGFTAAVRAGSVMPVMCSSAINNVGIGVILDAIATYMPSPLDRLDTVMAADPETGDPVELLANDEGTFSALVYKTVSDQFGKQTMFRIFSGCLKGDATVLNTTTGKTERLASLFSLRGKVKEPVTELHCGDFGCVTKLVSTGTNDTLCDVNKPVVLDKIEFPVPNMRMAAIAASRGDEEKIGVGFAKIMEEDPTFKYENNAETHQMVIYGLGDQHIDVIKSKLKNKFGVTVSLEEAKVPYREKIKKKVKVQGKHKKQSGGHGQYGDVWIEFEPHEGDELIFAENVFGGSVPKQYFPAVEKGLQDCVKKGVLAGYPMIGLKATLVDGSYHDVDSNEMSFKVAASLAYKQLTTANPVLLEPVVHIEVTVPNDNQGDVMGDMNKRRGRVIGVDQLADGLCCVIGEVPESEVMKYATDLRAMTQGRGSYTTKFERYEEVPPFQAQKIIAAAEKDHHEE
ncbi:MAG: elongation factor G [Clostridia bacterium]|nr:elongation factor G [Clostridia bacterium]